MKGVTGAILSSLKMENCKAPNIHGPFAIDGIPDRSYKAEYCGVFDEICAVLKRVIKPSKRHKFRQKRFGIHFCRDDSKFQRLLS